MVILLVIIIILLRLPYVIIIILVIVILLIIIVLRLPYDPEIGRKLLSPPELLKRQPVFSHWNQNHGNFPIQNLQFQHFVCSITFCSSCQWWGCPGSSRTTRRRRWRRWARSCTSSSWVWSTSSRDPAEWCLGFWYYQSQLTPCTNKYILKLPD